MSRPLIGITCYVESARWGPWDTRAALIPYGYVRMVEQAGGRAVISISASNGWAAMFMSISRARARPVERVVRPRSASEA